jgi:hypothetical protein
VIQYRLEGETEWKNYNGLVGAAPAPLKNNLTLYVSATGSDETGDGTSAKPFRQIQKAIDSIPKDLGGHKVTINVAEGTYNGVVVQGFHSGQINFYGASNTTTHITNGLYFQRNAAHIYVRDVHISTGYNGVYDVYCSNCQVVDLLRLVCDSTASYGLMAYAGGTVNLFDSTISNKNTAVVSELSRVDVSNSSGSKNSIGFRSGIGNNGHGGLILLNTSLGVLSADTMYITDRSGHIIAEDTFK